MSKKLSLDDLAGQINSKHQAVLGAARTAVLEAKAAGDLLLKAKRRLKHGEWLGWLQTNCNPSERTCNRYMQLAAGWSEIAPKVKSANVSDLTISKALRILSEDKNVHEVKVRIIKPPMQTTYVTPVYVSDAPDCNAVQRIRVERQEPPSEFDDDESDQKTEDINQIRAICERWRMECQSELQKLIDDMRNEIGQLERARDAYVP